MAKGVLPQMLDTPVFRPGALFMSFAAEAYDSYPPEKFVVEVFSELSVETIRQRAAELNVILRMSMLSGLQMHLEATLNLLGDFAAEITPHDHTIFYFWDDEEERVRMVALRGFEETSPEPFTCGNVLNFWTTKFGRPMLVDRGHNVQADALLETLHAQSALAIPLMVSNRAMGSMQLFASRPKAFTQEDAQLLWILALVAENQLTRDYANEGLVRFAFTDYLTGLKTRGYFEQQLEAEVARSERKDQPFALLMVDIDFFKQLNDRYGHHAGDQVLRDVAAILMRDMREVDTVARYGGEEFVIILPETNGPGALFVAERLRRAVEQSKFFAGSPHAVEHLSISIGVAIFGQDAKFKRDLIECADSAMYAAKNSGRNRVLLYSDLERVRHKEVS
jgi:diguanylate cyclase (GGDEF)-like protein